MSKVDMTRVSGKYAEQRVKFLEDNASEMLEAMIADDSIYKHLELVQNMASSYVDNYVSEVKKSDTYKKAERDCDLIGMAKIIKTAQLTADIEAGDEWIYTLPDADTDEDEVKKKTYDEMNYAEAVEDIYNDIRNIREEIKDIELEEETEE